MKLISQILGSVSPSSVSCCAGNLLFISNREIILSPGDDGKHISFHHSKHHIYCIGSSLSEPIFAGNFFSQNVEKFLKILHMSNNCQNV